MDIVQAPATKSAAIPVKEEVPVNEYEGLSPEGLRINTEGDAKVFIYIVFHRQSPCPKRA